MRPILPGPVNDPAIPVTVAQAAALDMERERCETCGHRAYVMVITIMGPLAFCAHHFTANACALERVSAIIHDNRDRLVPTNRAAG